MRTHLFVRSKPDGTPPGITVSTLPLEPAAAAAALDAVLSDRTIDVIVFWDFALGPLPWAQLDDFRGSLDDAWLAPREASTERDILRYAEPVWVYRPNPAPHVIGAVAWRLDPRAAFIRADAVRVLGGLDPVFETLDGAMHELGLRLLMRGAVCRQQPITSPLSGRSPSLVDQYRLLRRCVSPKWTAYSFARRITETPLALGAELRALRSSRSEQPRPSASVGALQRDLDRVSLPDGVTVSVVLPTFGRYRYVAEVLDDLRAQTIQPTQILIADGNPPSERQPEVYERYRDLPIEVLWHEQPGICSGRNACLARATGQFVWFVDDDSRFDRKNLEMHLRTLLAYGGDVSVGPAYTKGRPELAPEQRETRCAFMDCGTTLCRRDLLTKIGGFDMQFNLYLRGEDNDLGIRFVRAGGLMLNNPNSKRFHYLAPVGGSRTAGSAHVFSRWSLRPRPVQSIFYLARRHFEPSAAWDSMLQGAMSVGWRRPGERTTPLWRLKNLVAEIAAAPLTALRFYRSYRVGREMIEEGPKIPVLSEAGSRRNSAY